MGVSGQCHALAAFCLRGKTPGTHWIGGCVGLRAGLDIEARGQILCLCQESNPSHTVCSQTLLTELLRLIKRCRLCRLKNMLPYRRHQKSYSLDYIVCIWVNVSLFLSMHWTIQKRRVTIIIIHPHFSYLQKFCIRFNLRRDGLTG
jgi:hypothetical protein